MTHDQEEALEVADRVLMNAGKIEQFGTPQEVYENRRLNLYTVSWVQLTCSMDICKAVNWKSPGATLTEQVSGLKPRTPKRSPMCVRMNWNCYLPTFRMAFRRQ